MKPNRPREEKLDQLRTIEAFKLKDSQTLQFAQLLLVTTRTLR